MKGLTFNAPDSARNATFAHDAETNTLWVKVDLNGPSFKAKTGNMGDMYAKLHTVFDTESGERIRLGFNCMPVVKKSQVLSANAALQAKIRELEARLKTK
jgi:hypothetical protein